MYFNPDDRHILVISGKQSECLNFAKKLVADLDYVEINEPKKASSLLGQEFDAIIYHSHSSLGNKFDPNAFGAVTGTIRGGGFLLLLKPKNYPADSLFLKRFNQLIKSNENVHFLDPKHSELMRLPEPPRKNFANVFATEDQENAVDAILKVATGHRRRPLVITSDRGRGKSAALGIAAGELNKQDINNLIICAPSKKIASIVFQHAALNQDLNISSYEGSHEKKNLQFYSPDELQQQQPNADLVMIDEAAAIPIALLTIFLKRYARIVFASTQHGYEGSGRGFAINFRKVLDNETPEWKNCHLNTPIRWQENDSLEKFTFDALLLNAEPEKPSAVENASISDCIFTQVNKLKLLENNTMLEQLFGLLVSAHYQTKPSDLMQLLDDESITIYCLSYKKSIIAVALIVQEGEIDQALSTEIFEGKRRIKGHLVAQSLSTNVGIEFASQLSGERIIRIAVHSSLQQQGFGKLFLNILVNRSDADYLSTSYGVTKPLLCFWQESGFIPVYLGIKRDASSGTHSVIMLHARSVDGNKVLSQARQYFSRNFPHLLSDPLRNLECDVALALLPDQVSTPLSLEESRMLQAFATGQRGYENNLYLIWKLVCEKLPGNELLDEAEKRILIIKVLQKNTWKTTIGRMDTILKGKKEALQLLRSAVAGILR